MGHSQAKLKRRQKKQLEQKWEEFAYKIQKLTEELQQRSKNIEELKATAEQVTSNISQHDRELVEDHISTIQKKLSKTCDGSKKQLQTYETLIQVYNAVLSEVEGYVSWLRNTLGVVGQQPVIGFSVAQAEETLQQSNDLLKEVQNKQSVLDSLRHQVKTSLKSLSIQEQEQVEKRLADLQEQHRLLHHTVTERRKQLQKEVVSRKAIQGDLDKISDWLKDKQAVTEGGLKVPLQPKDILKELENKKALFAEVKHFNVTVDRFMIEGSRLMEQSENGDREMMNNKLQDIRTRYTNLRRYLENAVDVLQEAHVRHRQLDSDIVKIDLWLKEAENLLAKPIQLNSATEIIREQVKKYQNLANSSHVQQSLVEGLADKSTSILPTLQESDQNLLKDKLHTVRENVKRIQKEISDRLSTLEEALSMKVKFEEEIIDLTRQLCLCQEELKIANRAIGPHPEDAKLLQQKVQKQYDLCVDLKSRLAGLQQRSEQLRILGHYSTTDELNHIMRMHTEIMDQAILQRDKLTQAITLREQYHVHKGEIENMLKISQEQIDAVEVLGVAVHTRLDRYKDVLEKLQSKAADISLLSDRAQQIGIEGSSADANILQNQIKCIQNKVEDLRRDTTRKLEHLQNVVAERQGFEEELKKTVSFLHQKDTLIQSHDHLDMDVENIEKEVSKLQDIKADVSSRVQVTQEQIDQQKAHYDQLDEVIPLEVQDKIDEMEELKEKIKTKIQEEEKKLKQAKTYRVQFRTTWQEISDWLKQLDDSVNSDDEGTNYEMAESQLQQHKEMYGCVKEIHKKMDVLLDLSEHLAPTLDMNDKATLKESIVSLNQKVSDVTAAAEVWQKHLEETIATWKQYQEHYKAVETYLKDAETSWKTTPEMPLTSLEQARKQLEITDNYLSGLEAQREMMTQLKSLTEDIDRQASATSQAVVDKMLAEVMEKYNNLKLKAEERQAAMQETVDNWLIYQQKADAFKFMLQKAEAQLLPEELQRITAEELHQQLLDSKGLVASVEQCHSELVDLQRAAQTVLVQLPTSEAKMALQKDLLNMQDQYEHLQWKAREQQHTLEAEVADHEKFIQEMANTDVWLNQLLEELHQHQTIGLSVDEVQDNISKHEVQKQDISLRLAHIQHAIDEQIDRYGESISDLPQDLQRLVLDFEQHKATVTQELEKREQLLQEAKTRCQQYQTCLDVLRPWLDDTESRLDEAITDVEQGPQQHQALISEISLFQPKLELLEAHIKQISANATEEDKQLMAGTLSDLKSRWDRVVNQADTKMAEYKKAAELWQEFTVVSQLISDWSEHAEETARTEFVWQSLEEAHDQTEKHRAFMQEGAILESKFKVLEHLTEQLAPYCTQHEIEEKVKHLYKAFTKAQTISEEQLVRIEETVKEWKDCQDQVSLLRDLMEEAKQSIDATDTGVTLEQMLAKQEQVIQEIEKHEEKVSSVLAKHEKLRSLSGVHTPTEGMKLATEIAALKDEAYHQRDRLKKLMEEQLKHEEEVKQVQERIDLAQGMVEESKQRSESVDEMKKKVTEAKLEEQQQKMKETIEKQQQYQRSVQDITRHLEETQQRLADIDPNHISLSELPVKIRENQDLSLELQLIYADIQRLEEQGQQLALSGTDHEGKKTIKAALKMLQDRYSTLRALSEEKNAELQMVQEHHQVHNKQLKEFQDKLKEYEDWLTRAKIAHAGEPMVGYDVTYLRSQIRENQNLQDELDERLQQLSDMTVECGQLSEFDLPGEHDTLHIHVNNLHAETAQFKHDMMQKLERLRVSLKECEKKKKDLDEYRKSTDNLRRWIQETKAIGEGSSDALKASALMTEQQKLLQQKLEEELADHQNLLLSVSKAAAKLIQKPGDATDEDEPLTPEALNAKWKTLSRQLSERKTQLQDIIEHSEPGDFMGLPLQAFRPHHLSKAHDYSGATHLYDVRQSLLELNSCWEKLQSQVDDKQARLENMLQFQHLYQEALLRISAWLDDIEAKLFITRPDLTTADLLTETELLQEELQTVQAEVAKMSQSSEQLMLDASPESRNVIRQTIEDLSERLLTLEKHAEQKKDRLKQEEEQLRLYQTKIRELQRQMSSTHQRYAKLLSSDMSLQQKVTEQQRLDDELARCEHTMKQLQTEAEKMLSENPSLKIHDLLNMTHNQWKDLENIANTKRAELEKASASYAQYERMLHEFEEYLETAQNKLKADTISARDLSHLQNQLTAHVGFFTDLQRHQTLLDALVQHLDKSTCHKYENTHKRLMNLMHIIQDRAAIYGQKLERLIQDWVSFHEQFEDMLNWFSEIEKQLPVKEADNEGIGSTEELRRLIWDYHTVEKALENEKAAMYEIVDRGHQLLQSISCPVLETELADFAERWVQISSETSTELKKLQTVLDQWEQFERDANAFEDWLEGATNQASRLAQLEKLDTQNIVVLRNKMEHFLDFRKDVENQQPIKTKISTLGQQLQRFRSSDVSLQQRIERIESQWLQLVGNLPNSEEQLHQAQMELLPSRQALNELLLWLEGIESTICEDTGRILLNLVDTQVMLQKYRGLKVDIANRQLTVDFVNQSSLQGSVADIDSTQSTSYQNEKTEFDERLGQMNKRYQLCSSDVAERLKNLEMLETKWQEFEKSYNNLVNWFSDQQDRLDKFSQLGHEASLQQNISECQVLQEKLHQKETEIDQLRKLGLTMIENRYGKPSPEGSVVIQGMIDELSEKCSALSHETFQTVMTLEDALRQWTLYNNALQRCNQVLTETEYSFNRFNIASGDIEAFKSLINKIKVLKGEFESAQDKLQQLTDTAAKLIQISEPTAITCIQKNVDDIQNRWQQLTALLSSRLISFEELYVNWSKYEREFAHVHSWLESREHNVNTLLQHSRDSDNLEQVIAEAKTHLHEVDMFRQNVTQLSHLSAQLTNHMDSATIIQLTSREAILSERLQAMHQALSRLLHALQRDLTKKSRFQSTYKSVDSFLASADSLLRSVDPSQSAEEEVLRSRINELRDLSTQFSCTQPDLDSLNLIGYRLPLSEDESEHLKSLNQKWYSLSSDTAERYKTIQAHLLLQQDFNEKCQAWMAFLGQVENSLATLISGTYDGLLEQQKAHETFQNEIYSRQQILHAIIAEGHQMIRNGDVDDCSDFEHKLNMLQDQWQSVLRRSQQRRVVIDNLLHQWQIYDDNLEQLNHRLDLISQSVAEMDIQMAPLQKIRNLYSSLKSLQGDIKSLEVLLHKANDTGKMLMQNTDLDTQNKIQADLSELQKKWESLIGELDSRQHDLETMIHQWEETEEGMEDLFEWLKELRKSLTHELPDNYDDLLRELQMCKEYDTSFKNSSDQKLRLSHMQEELASHISSQDINIMQQRIHLLNKQWQELQQQVEMRHQLVMNRLARWEVFNDKYHDLMEQMNSLEKKISSGKEYHIEDFLYKLKNEYDKEMQSIDKDREHLVCDGQILMQASSSIRASDIEYKLSKINDKWTRLREKATSRCKKLQETLTVVQQLEQNMSSLRKWLAHIEHELSSPIVYTTPDFMEIQSKLQNQQDLQRDIHKHSTGVASVINLCEVMLHDTDACPSIVEQTAIQEAIHSLDKRWKNICNLSLERRQRIEETWHLWQKFHEEDQRFSDWLREAERTVANPRTEHVSFAAFREELRKFETFQRTLHEKLHSLDQLNKQYRRLAREGRTDTSGNLKREIHDLNKRWDELSKKCQCVLRRLRHMINVRDDFEATREALMVWLSEVNSKVTQIEHFSETSNSTKIKDLETLQNEIEQNSHRLQYIEKAGEYLLQKCEAHDAVQIQRDIDEFRQVVDGVITRLNKYLNKLKKASGEELATSDAVDTGPVPDLEQIEQLISDVDDSDTALHFDSDSDSNFEEFTQAESGVTNLESAAAISKPVPRTQSDTQQQRNVGSVHTEQLTGLDWDMSDIAGAEASAHITAEDMPDGSQFEKIRQKVSCHGEKLQRVEGYLRELEKLLKGVSEHLRNTELQLRAPTPVGPEADGATGCYTTYVTSCKDRVDKLSKLEKKLKQETGLPSLYGAETQIRGVVKRWHSLYEQAVEKDHRLESRRQQWLQMRTDLHSLLSWLDDAERVQLRQNNPPSDINQLETAVHLHKDFLLEVDTRRPLVLSINLLSKEISARHGTSVESLHLQQEVETMNQRWDRVCARAAVWQKELQIALFQGQDFNKTLDDLFTWLKDIESEIRRQEPVDFSSPPDQLLVKYRKFGELKYDLEDGEERVICLHDTTDSLLSNSGSKECTNTREQLHVAANQLRSLLKICNTYMSHIEDVLNMDRESLLALMSSSGAGIKGSGQPTFHTVSALSPRSPQSYLSRRLVALASDGTFSLESDETIEPAAAAAASSATPQQQSSFLSRVCRMALPIQGLMLMLLGVASLVPMSEEDFSCALVNNFRRSLDPMLQYTEGPPPF